MAIEKLKLDLSKSLAEITHQLILIPSESKNERELFLLIKETLISLKIPNAKLVTHGNNLVFDFSSNLFDSKKTKLKTVALVGHLDTVPASKENHTVPKIKGNELWGLGAVDMKSGLACMLKFAYDFSKGKIKSKYKIRLVFYDREELSLPNGMNDLLEKNALNNTDFAFVLEPTNEKYAIGCMGSIACKVIFEGRAAHSANPELGENAIYDSQKIIESVKKFGIKKDKIDGLGFFETMNVTQANTFNAANVIPEKFVVMINYRFSPKKSSEQAISVIKKLVGNKKYEMPDVSPSTYLGKKGDAFLLPNKKRTIMQAWTDIAQLNLAGIPAINYGPGSIEVAHKPDERISIKELDYFYTQLVLHLI